MNSNIVQEITGDRGIKNAALAVFVVLALFLLVQTIGGLKGLSKVGGPATEVISVNGEGQATMAPDIAKITFTVENTAPTVAAAQSKTTEQAKAALDAIKGQGIDEKDIKTLSYNINPQYSYPNPCSPGMACPAYTGAPRITGYQVSNTVEVKVRDLAKVGDLLASVGKLGVQNVSGPAFALDDSTAGYSAARKDAIEKAKMQAELIAKQLGVRLGKVTSFYESTDGGSYPMAYGMGGDMMNAKAESAPTIQAGQNTYRASVSITYEIR